MQLITRTLQSINAIDFNDTPDSNDYSYVSDLLNMMIKMWEVDGIHLFKRFQATLFPQLNQYSYQLGSVSGADNVCPSTNYVTTTVNSVVSTSSNLVTVLSLNGIVVGQNIGLEQDDGTRLWGVVNSINTGTLTLTCSFTTTTTAQVNNTVVLYSKKINRPLEILRGNTLDLKAANSEVTMEDLSYDEYFDLPVKNTPGRPNNFYYDRILSNGLPFTGTLYLYNAPNKVYQIVNFTYTDCLQDMLNSTDNFDLPQEWLLPIMTNLAALLANFGYGKQINLESLQTMADRHYQILKSFDSDTESLKISKDDNNTSSVHLG